MLARALILVFATLSPLSAWAVEPAPSQPAVAPGEARAIARDAVIYGFPLVDSYRVNYSYFVDSGGPEFKAPWNQLRNTPRVYTPDDKTLQTPNSDTPYSALGLDLRAEPIVITVPAIEKSRYFSVQLVDQYTHNYAYIGTRTTGNGGGSFLVAGPDWSGETPPGIARVFRSETRLGWALYRTQLFNPADLDAVKKVQDGYKVQSLSRFLGTPPPPPAAPIDFVRPLTPEQERTSPAFFEVLNFVLQFCPTDPSETALMARFARLGIGAGQSFDASKLSPELRQAVTDGMADGWNAFAEFKKANMDTLKVTSGDLFGTRAFLGNDYMRRMTGVVLGIYGNSKEEAMYPAYFVDATGTKPDGAAHRYTLRFAPGQFPPVDAFWSLTMYELPSSLLSANPLNRYLINSAMLPDMKRDADGGLTLTIQHEAPGRATEANWLPAPDGPFFMVMRLYLPKADALDGTWKQPSLQRADAPAPEAATLETVTPETYIRAETDRNFQNIFKLTGEINRLFHFRSPTPLDKQAVVRMNKDTLYSGGIVDTSAGATVTLPATPDGRYMSILLVDNDHYSPAVFYTPGTHELPRDTKYLAVLVRTQVFNPGDPAEIALINRLQDQVVITAGSADPLPPLKWEPTSLQGLTQRYEADSTQYSSWKGMMGPRGKVDEQTRHIAAAAAWGLFPEWDATYLNYSGGHDLGSCRRATYQVPENKGFWSITVYGSDGYLKSENSILNGGNAKLNADGTFTAYFGSKQACGDVANRLDVADGWNFLMRIYRPGPTVLDGSYKLPSAEAVE